MPYISSFASFPAVVNEKAARVVAAFVAAGGVLGIVTQWRLVPLLLAIGFARGVLSGPRLSPLGRLAAQVIAPRLGEARMVPGAPKRFAQGIGLAMTTAASVAAFGGFMTLATGLLAVLVVFALLEAVLGFCAGCTMFAWLMKIGLVPESVCVECADITLRHPSRVVT